MKRVIGLLLLLAGLNLGGQAQNKFFTRTGQTTFFSQAPVENIEAQNYQTSSIFDMGKGEVAFSIPIKGFEFRKALMQEHFNENYLESDKYTKATFKGTINNMDRLNWQTSGTKEVVVTGAITIHGVTKEMETNGELTYKDGKIEVYSTFPITVEDFDIKIPRTVINNIAESVDVTVQLTLEPYLNQ